MKRFIFTLLLFSISSVLHANPEFEELLLRAVQYDSVFNDRRYNLQSELLQLSASDSRLYPQIVASFSRVITEADVDGPEANVTSQGDYKTSTASLSLEQLLFNASVFAEVSASEKRMLALASELKYERDKLIERVSSSYTDYQNQLYVLDALNKRLELSNLVYQQSLREKTKGLVSELALALAESEKSQAELEWLSAKSQLADFQENLSRSVRLNQAAKVDMCKILVSVPEKSNIDWAAVYYKNARLKQLSHEVEAQEYELKSRRSDYYPTISLSVSYSEREQDGGSFDNSQNNQSVLSLNVELPIYLGGSRNKNLYASSVRLQAKQDQLATERQSLVGVLEALYERIRFLELRNSVSEKAIAATQKAYQIAGKDFNLGAISSRQLIESESTYLDMLAQQQRVCGELLTTSIRIHHALGTTQYFKGIK